MAVHQDSHHHEDEMYRTNTREGLLVFGIGFVALVIVAAIAWWLAHLVH